MKLSGWTRLWIVASMAWWAFGTWWLVNSFEPRRTYQYSIPSADIAPISPAGIDAPAKREPPSDMYAHMYGEPRVKEVVGEDWASWLNLLVLVVGAPFVVGGAVALVLAVSRRVWRRFKAASK